MAEMAYVALYTARTRAFLCNGKSLVMDPFSATTAAANIIEREGSYQVACHMLRQRQDRISSCQTSRIGASVQSSPLVRHCQWMTYRSSTIYTCCRNTFDDQQDPSEPAHADVAGTVRHTMIDLAPLPGARAFAHACRGQRGLLLLLLLLLRGRLLRVLPIAGPILLHDIGASSICIHKAPIDWRAAGWWSRAGRVLEVGLVAGEILSPLRVCSAQQLGEGWMTGLATLQSSTVRTGPGRSTALCRYRMAAYRVMRLHAGLIRVLTSGRWLRARAGVVVAIE